MLEILFEAAIPRSMAKFTLHVHFESETIPEVSLDPRPDRFAKITQDSAKNAGQKMRNFASIWVRDKPMTR